MVDNEPPYDESDVVRFEFLETVYRHRRILIAVPLLAATFVFAVAGAYVLWLQPSARVYRLAFRATFDGAADAQYPNDLPFSASDIIAPPVIEQVFAANNMAQFCEAAAFQNGFSIAPVADHRLDYVLIFSMPRECSDVPPVTASKVVSDVVRVWAEQSESRRGVLQLEAQVLTPNLFDVDASDAGSPIIRAHLIRAALSRLVANAQDIERRPGAGLIRAGQPATTFSDVRARLQSLIAVRLDVLVLMSGRGMGAESLEWVDQATVIAVQEEAAAEALADAYRNALREYSQTGSDYASVLDQAATTLNRSVVTSPSAGDPSLVTPQIDRALVNRLVDISVMDTRFRQELTRNIFAADTTAIEARKGVAYYRHLASALRRGSGLTATEVEARLQDVVSDAKALAQQFEDLYQEWSLVALRPAAEMYHAPSPVTTETSRPYRLTSLLILVVASFVLALMTTAIVVLSRDRYLEWRIRGSS